MHILYCFCCGTNVYCLPISLIFVTRFALPSFVHVFPLVSYMNVPIPIVLCCGAKWVLFTNTSQYWCHIIKPYLFTKFHASKHSGKRVTKHYSSQVGMNSPVNNAPPPPPPFLAQHACCIVIYGPKLFIVVSQKVYKVFTNTYSLHVTKLYISIMFHMWVYSS